MLPYQPFELLARREARHAARGDADRGAGARIQDRPRPPTGHVEGPEADELHLLALLQGTRDVFDEGGEHPVDVRLGEPGVPRHPAYDLGPVHGLRRLSWPRP